MTGDITRCARQDSNGPAQHHLRLSAATIVHSRPSTQLTAVALVHGYTVAFWWSAAILVAGAVIALALFRNGPLPQAGRRTSCRGIRCRRQGTSLTGT
jgi:hypothetical protein